MDLQREEGCCESDCDFAFECCVSRFAIIPVYRFNPGHAVFEKNEQLVSGFLRHFVSDRRFVFVEIVFPVFICFRGRYKWFVILIILPP